MPDRILLFFSGTKTVQKNVSVPLSLLAVAGPLVKAGYAVDFLDSRISAYEDVDLTPYALVGISSVTGRNMAPAVRFAKKVRREAPHIPIVWGGIHASALPEQSLDSGLVDVAVLGEGDRTFLELTEALFQGAQDFSFISGLAYRRDGQFVRTPTRPFLDMEELEPMPYHLLDPQAYGYKRHMIYISSRGCPHTCSFCYNRRHNASKWRALSAGRVLEDLNGITRGYAPKGISFFDDNFFVSKKRVSEICEGFLKRGWSFTWGASCRTDYLADYDRDFIELLVRSGLRTINIGVESGSQRMLNLWCGNKEVENHYKAMEKMRDYPVECSASFMMGYPGETDEDLKETFRLIQDMKRINPRLKVSWMNIIFPFPGTDLHERFQEYGFTPPSSLEEWSRTALHSRELTRCHPPGRMKKLDSIHKLSLWCYFGDSFDPGRAWKQANGTGKWPHLLASLSSSVRFQSGWFGLPLDIHLLHRKYRSSVDFDVPD